MLNTASSTTSQTPDRYEARRQALLARLRPLFEQAAADVADDLAGLADDELFGAIEHRLRDRVHQLATAAHQAGLDDRKKGGIKAPPPSAPTATTTPPSRATFPAAS